MNALEKAVRRIDSAQQAHQPFAFLFALNKKYGDDRGGQLTALITYYGFLSLFPLFLVLATVLGIVAGSRSAWTASVERSALAQFPVIGTHLATSIHELHRNSVVGLVVGIVGLLWGSQGAAQIGQFAMAEVWNVPGVQRPNFWSRLGRTYALIGALGLFLVAGSGLAALASSGHHPPLVRVGEEAGSVAVNLLMYLAAFALLTPKAVPRRSLVPGALGGGVAWSVLQVVGTLLVNHQLRNTSQVYGFFAIVLGLIAWIALGAMVTMYAAEMNVVLARRLWPRSMVQPPLTPADQEVLTAIAKQGQRRPEQQVHVDFEGGGGRSSPGGAAP